LRATAVASFVAALLLVALFALALPVASEMQVLETSLDPQAVFGFLHVNAVHVMIMYSTDNLFTVAYTTAFAGLGLYLLPRHRAPALLGMGLALLTSASDLVENALTIALARAAMAGQVPEGWTHLALNMLAQLKFLWVYAAAPLFAIGLWAADGAGAPRRLERAVAVLFLAFPVIGVFAPISAALGLLRIAWMLVLLVAGGGLLWRAAAGR
jgi:hypothetical protein